MIITHDPHRPGAGSRQVLHDYVLRSDGTLPVVIGVFNTIGTTPAEAMRGMELMRDASRASIAFQHITINPRHNLSGRQRDLAVSRILRMLGAEDHSYVLVEHHKERATPDRANHHFHLVIGHVGPNLKALDMSHSYARLEAVARSLEIDFGEELTTTRRPKAVAYFARRMGRDDVADQVLKMASEFGETMPQAAISRTRRHWAKAHGIEIAKARHEIETAWRSSDCASSFERAIAECGYVLTPGLKDGVWIVMSGRLQLGALNRFLRHPQDEVAARMADAVRAHHNPEGDLGLVYVVEPNISPSNPNDRMSEPVFSERWTEPSSNDLVIADPDPVDIDPDDAAVRHVLEDSRKRVAESFIISKASTIEPEEPAELIRKREAYRSALRAARDAGNREEAARKELRKLEAERPKTIFTRIASRLTGRLAKLDASYEEAKRVHEAAKKDLRFRERHAQSLKVALASGEAAWEKEQRETDQKSVLLVHGNEPDLGRNRPRGVTNDRNGQREDKPRSWPDLRNP